VSKERSLVDVAVASLGPLRDDSALTPFDTNWKKGSGATPFTTQDL
jgi:hypothetical protein